MPPLDPADEARFFAGVEHTGRFFMGDSDVQRALADLVRALDDAQIPYAIIGALALGEYGYRRATDDVDVLLTPDGLGAFKAAYLGRGYIEKSPGSKGLRDTTHRVDIDVVLAGDTRTMASRSRSIPGAPIPEPHRRTCHM